jgi:3-hydroxyisobutyrate dehydrogenase-like beta-hydroxyacid dehydrogenase
MEKVAFIGFGEAGQTIGRGLLGVKKRLGGHKTDSRAELVRAIRAALGKPETGA